MYHIWTEIRTEMRTRYLKRLANELWFKLTSEHFIVWIYMYSFLLFFIFPKKSGWRKKKIGPKPRGFCPQTSNYYYVTHNKIRGQNKERITAEIVNDTECNGWNWKRTENKQSRYRLQQKLSYIESPMEIEYAIASANVNNAVVVCECFI